MKTSLILRITLMAIVCFGLATVAVLLQSDRAARRQAAAAADLVAKHLSFQLLRINAGFDASKRFPDWDALLANNVAHGQCVRFENEHGTTVRSDCVGSPGLADAAPHWFLAAWSRVAKAEPATSPISYKGKDYGAVVVTSDLSVVASRAWGEMTNLLLLTALTILAVCVLVYVAMARALAPTREVIAGLNQLSAGAFSHRLGRFKLTELQRIAEVANELALKIETTLSERAELSRRLMNAQEEERRHLARELHDELGQNLTAIAALASSLEKAVAVGRPDLGAEARTLSQLTVSSMQSLRGTLAHLRPADLDRFGLRDSLKQLIDVYDASHGHQTRFDLDVPREIAPLSDTAAIHIFRIAQEGLTNAAKHAQAKTVRLRLEPASFARPKEPHAAAISLTIEDDGTGRRPNGNGAAKGMGLLNMQERVAALGGSITLDDRPGHGFTVRIVVPVTAADTSSEERPS